MQSLISFPSNVEVLSADIRKDPVKGAEGTRLHIYYEWDSQQIQRRNGTRRFFWQASAMGSYQPMHDKPHRQPRRFVVADVAIQVSIAYKDIDRVWKQRGIDLANETLDNLVMLYAIQNQCEFETEQYLTFVPLS
jgi:hypothetical protein